MKNLPNQQKAPLDVEILQELTLPNLEIVAQLEDLVKLTLECEKRDIASHVSFNETMQQLQEVQKSMELLQQYQQETLKTLEDIAKREKIDFPSEEESLSKESASVINQLQTLTSICEAAQERSHREILQNPDIHAELTKSLKESVASEAAKKRKRKNKFRTLGQDGWVPL